MYNNLLKRILFSHFFTFFPIPKSKFRRIMGKNGDFFYFENRKFVSLSFHILFSPFFAHPQIQISLCLGKKWGWTPPFSRYCLSFYPFLPSLSLSLSLSFFHPYNSLSHPCRLPLFLPLMSSFLSFSHPSLSLSLYISLSHHASLSLFLPPLSLYLLFFFSLSLSLPLLSHSIVLSPIPVSLSLSLFLPLLSFFFIFLSL